jgi:hypothetical protein
MENKQTAVEWYGIQMGILISKFLNGEISKSNLHFKRLELEIEAMQMEKNQITEAYNESFRLRHKPYSTADKFYNETYQNKTK